MNREISYSNQNQEAPYEFEEGLGKRRPSLFETPLENQSIFNDADHDYQFPEMTSPQLQQIEDHIHSQDINSSRTADHQYMNQNYTYYNDNEIPYGEQASDFIYDHPQNLSHNPRDYSSSPYFQADYYIGHQRPPIQFDQSSLQLQQHEVSHNYQNNMLSSNQAQSAKAEEQNDSTDYSSVKVENIATEESKRSCSTPLHSSSNESLQEEDLSEDLSSQPSSLNLNKREKKAKRNRNNKKDRLYTKTDLENEIEYQVNLDQKVREMQNELQILKTKNLNKKELQVQRNRITAQLSRDRKKIENDFLKDELMAMKQQVRELQFKMTQGGDFCPKCCDCLISHFNLQQKKTRVSSNQIRPNNQASDSEQIKKEDKPLLQKRTTNDRNINLNTPQRRGAIQFGDGLSSKATAGLALIALVAIVCFVGQQQPTLINSDSALKAFSDPSQSSISQPPRRNLLGNNYKPNENPIAIYHDFNDPIPIVIEPILNNSNAYDMMGNPNAKSMLTQEQFEELQQMAQIMTIKQIRENYIAREAIRLIENSNLTIASSLKSYKEILNRYIIRPINTKGEIPSYYRNEYSSFASDEDTLQIDDDDNVTNDHEKFIQNQGKEQKKKFLNTHNEQQDKQIVVIPNDIKNKLEATTVSVMCPTSQMILSSSFTYDSLNEDKFFEGEDTTLQLILYRDKTNLVDQNSATSQIPQYSDKSPQYYEMTCKMVTANNIYDPLIGSQQQQA